jgi:hypothetical protein
LDGEKKESEISHLGNHGLYEYEFLFLIIFLIYRKFPILIGNSLVGKIPYCGHTINNLKTITTTTKVTLILLRIHLNQY